MTRLFYHKVTLKVYRNLTIKNGSVTDQSHFFTVKGKEYSDNKAIKSLLYKQPISDSYKEGPYIRDIIEQQLPEHSYTVADYNHKWKWKLNWTDFLKLRFNLKWNNHPMYDKYLKDIKEPQQYVNYPTKP
jgi:hypothetical protein